MGAAVGGSKISADEKQSNLATCDMRNTIYAEDQYSAKLSPVCLLYDTRKNHIIGSRNGVPQEKKGIRGAA